MPDCACKNILHPAGAALPLLGFSFQQILQDGSSAGGTSRYDTNELDQTRNVTHHYARRRGKLFDPLAIFPKDSVQCQKAPGDEAVTGY